MRKHDIESDLEEVGKGEGHLIWLRIGTVAGFCGNGNKC
jgi:hypothetical protein